MTRSSVALVVSASLLTLTPACSAEEEEDEIDSREYAMTQPNAGGAACSACIVIKQAEVGSRVLEIVDASLTQELLAADDLHLFVTQEGLVRSHDFVERDDRLSAAVSSEGEICSWELKVEYTICYNTEKYEKCSVRWTILTPSTCPANPEG